MIKYRYLLEATYKASKMTEGNLSKDQARVALRYLDIIQSYINRRNGDILTLVIANLRQKIVHRYLSS